MYYHSIDHFLTVNAQRIPELFLAAWQEVGGYYAQVPPDALRLQADEAAQAVTAALRQGALDPGETQSQMRDWSAQGVAMSEIRQGTQLFDQGLRALVAQELANQPELRTELERRIGRLGARFRASVTTVELEDNIARLTKTRSTSGS